MSATLTISVSDATLARLQKRAADCGTTPEAVAAETVERLPLDSEIATVVPDAAPPAVNADQPRPPEWGSFFRKWAGKIDYPEAPADWADRHDYYLGQAQYDTMQNGDGNEALR